MAPQNYIGFLQYGALGLLAIYILTTTWLQYRRDRDLKKLECKRMEIMDKNNAALISVVGRQAEATGRQAESNHAVAGAINSMGDIVANCETNRATKRRRTNGKARSAALTAESQTRS